MTTTARLWTVSVPQPGLASVGAHCVRPPGTSDRPVFSEVVVTAFRAHGMRPYAGNTDESMGR